MSELSPREIYVAEAPYCMRELMEGHTNDGFEFLDGAPGTHPSQNPLRARLQGLRASTEATDYVATQVHELYTQARDEKARDSQTLRVVDEIIAGLRKRRNYLFVSPHGDIRDIAFGLKFGTDLIELRTEETGENQDLSKPESGIIVSEGVTETGYRLKDGTLLPTTLALRLLCSDVFRLWPHSEKARRVLQRLPEAEWKRHNRQSLTSTHKNLDHGAYCLTGAPTGTTEVKLGEKGTYELSEFGKGMVAIILREDVSVVPVVADFRYDTPILEMTTPPIDITDQTGVENLRHQLAEMHTEAPH